MNSEIEGLIEMYGVLPALASVPPVWRRMAQQRGNVSWEIWYYGNCITGWHPKLVGMPASPYDPPIPPIPLYVGRVG